MPRGFDSTGTSGRSCPAPASGATAPTKAREWWACGWICARKPSSLAATARRSCRATPMPAWSSQRIFADNPARQMPPVAIHKDLTRGAEGHHPAVDCRRRRIRRPLGVSAGPASSRACVGRAGEQSDRLLRVVAAAGGRTRAIARGGSPDPDSPRVAGFDRHRPVPRGSGRVPGRSVAARVRTGGGSAAGVAPLRGEAGHLLARRRPIRRHGRLPRRQSLSRLALPRLRAQGLQCQQAL